MCQNFRIVSIFKIILQILDLLQKFTSARNPISSGLKRVATGSVLKGYQTSLIAQLTKTLLENLNFDLI